MHAIVSRHGNGALNVIVPLFVILDLSVIDGRSGGCPVFVEIGPNAIFIMSPDIPILSTKRALPPELDASDALVCLSLALLKSDTSLCPRCALKSAGDFSSFTIGERGRFVIEPNAWLPSFQVDKRQRVEETPIRKPTHQTG